MNTPIAFEPFTVRFTVDFTQALLGLRAPEQLTAPSRRIRVDHPERFVGKYLRYDDRIEITEKAGRLHYQEFNDSLKREYKEMHEEVKGSQGGALVDEDLIPLGGDRFLVNFPGFANGMQVFFLVATRRVVRPIST